MTRIIDAFTFLNEVDLVKARLEYLNDVVTDFVIIESNLTWRNETNIPFFKTIYDTLPNKIKHKIHHKVISWPVELTNNIESRDTKEVENGTRQEMLNEIRKFAGDTDWVFVSDLDEFWDKDKLKDAIELYNNNGKVCWLQDNRTCFVDWTTPGYPEWPGTKMAKLKDITRMIEFYVSKNKSLRVNKGRTLFTPIKGGWHFTKMGDEQTKAKSMQSIQEWTTWETKINKTAEEAAYEIFKGSGWNRVAKKGKMKAKFTGTKGISKELIAILKKTNIFWSNGLKP